MIIIMIMSIDNNYD